MEKVIEVFRSLDVQGEISETSSLLDLGFNSLMIMELVILLEEKLSFHFKDEDITGDNFQTVGSILSILEKYVGIGV
nr:acyl carrier protein [Paenactinomyces guangxiensis]